MKSRPEASLDGQAYLDRLTQKWASYFDQEDWAKAVRYEEESPWSFGEMTAYLLRHEVQGVPPPEGVSPYYELLLELWPRMLRLSPNGARGQKLAEFCADLAVAPIHGVQNLLASCVVETLLKKSQSWRKYFFATWINHDNPWARSILAFATDFLDFDQKKPILRRLASDKFTHVRMSVLQSLWYTQEAYPAHQQADLREIVRRATAGETNEQLRKFAADLRRRNHF